MRYSAAPHIFFIRCEAAAQITVAFSASCFAEMFRYNGLLEDQGEGLSLTRLQ